MSINYSNKHGELKKGGGEIQKIAIEIDGTFLEKYPFLEKTTYMQLQSQNGRRQNGQKQFLKR